MAVSRWDIKRMSTCNFRYIINSGIKKFLIRKKVRIKERKKGMHPSIKVEVILRLILIRTVIFVVIETGNEETRLIWEGKWMFFRH